MHDTKVQESRHEIQAEWRENCALSTHPPRGAELEGASISKSLSQLAFTEILGREVMGRATGNRPEQK